MNIDAAILGYLILAWCLGFGVGLLFRIFEKMGMDLMD